MAQDMSDPKSVGDYLGVAFTLSTLPVVIVGDSVANLLAGRKRRPVMDTFLDSVMGHCYRQSTLRQLRILTPVHPLKDELSSILYTLTMSSSNLPNFNTPFEGQGFEARWISRIEDRKPEDPVILYMHGGGYSLKTCQPQVTYICNLAKILLPYRVSIVALDYGIAPFYRYPTQRNEGIACLSTLLQSCRRPILLGDSCGGNLALTVLLEEDVIPPGSVFGCALISPWTDPAAKGGSMDSVRDILSKQRLQEMCDNFVDRSQLDDPRVALMKVPAETWQRVLPKHCCVVWGEAECLADQAAAFTELVGIKDFFIERNGTHDCILRGMTPPPCEFVTEHLVQWVVGKEAAVLTPKEAKRLAKRTSVLKRSSTMLSKLKFKSSSSTSITSTSSSKQHSSSTQDSREHDSEGSILSHSSKASRHSKLSTSSRSSKSSKASKTSKKSKASDRSGSDGNTSRTTVGKAPLSDDGAEPSESGDHASSHSESSTAAPLKKPSDEFAASGQSESTTAPAVAEATAV